MTVDIAALRADDAIKFLETACRNWNHVPRLRPDDIEDVRAALQSFAAKQLAVQAARVAELEAALKPFAEKATERLRPDDHDNMRPAWNTAAEYRAAIRASKSNG